MHQVSYGFNSERLQLVLDAPGDRRGQMHRPFWQGEDSATLLDVGEAECHSRCLSETHGFPSVPLYM